MTACAKASMTKQATIIVSGRVQGVGFRYVACQFGKQWGLSGEASNEPDDSVKIVAEGEKENLQRLADWCYNGVALARVEKVTITWQEATGQFNGFEIKY